MAIETAPAVCYAICNNAYAFAESIGKTEALCEAGGDFMTGYNSCIKCITKNIGDSQLSAEEIIDPEFGQFLKFCSGSSFNVLIATTGTFTLNLTHVTTITYVVPISAVSTTSTSTTPTTTSTSVQPSSTSDLASSPSISPAASNTADGSKTQLAGPIAGSLVGLAVLIIAGLFFWRRRRTRKARNVADASPDHFEKAQLHSDCIPKPVSEISGGAVHEMEGSWIPQQPTAEKPANEVPAQELPGEGVRN